MTRRKPRPVLSRAGTARQSARADFIVNDSTPELSPIHPSHGKGTRDLGQENPHE